MSRRNSGAQPQSPFFRRVIGALTLAAPFALASRFDSLAHCVEASMCGAAALRRKHIKATARPCALVGRMAPEGVQFSVGLDARDVYGMLSTAEGPPPAFEEWRDQVARGSLPAEGSFVAHMVIDASFQGDRALVDLTLGQIRESHGVPVPHSMVCNYSGEWPSIGGDRWEARYVDSPHEARIQAMTRAYTANGLVDDLDALTDIALQCRGDVDLFFDVLARSQPEQFSAAMSRLQRFSLGDSPTSPT